MNFTDKTAVNPVPPEAAKRVRTLFPDPMNPHSLYDPNEDPRRSTEIPESDVVISRR